MNLPPGFAESALHLGVPCDILNWIPIVHIQCKCDGRVPLMIIGAGNVAVCPSCKRGRMIKSLAYDVMTNQTRLEVVDVMPQPQGDPRG